MLSTRLSTDSALCESDVKRASLIRRLLAPKWLGLLLLSILILTACFVLDASSRIWTINHQTPGWRSAARMISHYGDWPWLMLIGVVCLAGAWARASKQWMRIFVAMMVAASLAGITSSAVKAIACRARPNNRIEQGWFGPRHNTKWIWTKSSYTSFPSGHTCSSAAFVGVLFFARRRWGILMAPAALAIAASRIYVDMHHLSDVAAGGILGLAIALLTWRAFVLRMQKSAPQAEAAGNTDSYPYS